MRLLLLARVLTNLVLVSASSMVVQLTVMLWSSMNYLLAMVVLVILDMA